MLPIKANVVDISVQSFELCHNLFLKFKVVGMHEEWKGGNMELYPGGGHKLNLLRKEIEFLKNETDLVVMFTDR